MNRITGKNNLYNFLYKRRVLDGAHYLLELIIKLYIFDFFLSKFLIEWEASGIFKRRMKIVIVFSIEVKKKVDHYELRSMLF